MNFDELIDRFGTHSVKWDMMEKMFGVPAKNGLAMWVADMDFRPPTCVQNAVEAMANHGVYGYFGDDSAYLAAIQWWMKTRHGWTVPEKAIFTTHGLVNGTSLVVDTYTAPGDAVVLMTPVYHAFARVIRAAGRSVTECPLSLVDGMYQMDFERWEGLLTGKEKMLILCSPHNPGGRVWTRDELRATAEFCEKHNLILVSDEIHHDLLMPGQKHIPMPLAAPEIEGRLIMMTAATKTFNIAGSHTGNVIIMDEALRAPFAQRMMAMGISPNSFGMHMTTAAYSVEGAAWVDDLCHYLDGNRQVLDAAIADIPGVHSMPLQATYLGWVDFSGTGMAKEEILNRVEKQAQIAANHGESFGLGGESYLRFNFATPRSVVEQAAQRLKAAFADLQ